MMLVLVLLRLLHVVLVVVSMFVDGFLLLSVGDRRLTQFLNFVRQNFGFGPFKFQGKGNLGRAGGLVVGVPGVLVVFGFALFACRCCSGCLDFGAERKCRWSVGGNQCIHAWFHGGQKGQEVERRDRRFCVHRWGTVGSKRSCYSELF